jgi:hypothetical protein
MVYTWRNKAESKENCKKLSLKEVAKEMGVSKKTLDDYFKQIKLGYQNHFDFDYYKDSLIGKLRDYNSKFMKAKPRNN